MNQLDREDFGSDLAYVGAQLNEIAISLDIETVQKYDIEKAHDIICELRNLVLEINDQEELFLFGKVMRTEWEKLDK